MNTIVNAIPSYILTAVVSTALYFALKQSQTFIHAKVIHAKTEASRAAWSCAAQLADDAVASLVGKDMAGQEKFRQATDIVQQALQKQGIKNIDLTAIETAVQAAYEKSPLTPTTIPEVKPDSLRQKGSNLVPGTAEAIDPTKGEN